MKLFKQSLLVAAVLSGLSACSEEDFTPKAQVNENAPTHGGDIDVTINEKADFQFLYMLGTPEGKMSGEGVAVDLDANPLTVTDIVVNSDDTTGIEMGALKVGVRPELLVHQLDTGDTHTVTISYKVSDGVNTVDRNMVINITGEDFAPEFESDITAEYSKSDAKSTIDLLDGTSDKDGEALTIGNAEITATQLPDSVKDVADVVSIDGNNLIVDVPKIKDKLAIGQTLKYEVTFDVQDHNHNISRTAFVSIIGVSDVPTAPTVNAKKVFETSTSAGLVNMSLVSAPEIVDDNLDPLTVDFSDVVPTGEAPAFKFEKSTATHIKFNPAIFYSYVDEGQTKTFTYDYKISDGTYTVDSEFDIKVTNDGFENLITNGSFEDGLTGWTSANGFVTVSETPTLNIAKEDAKFAAFSATDTLSQSLPNLVEGETYVLEFKAQVGNGWGAPNNAIISGDKLVNGEVQGGQPLSSRGIFEHGFGSTRTYALAFTATTNVKLEFKATQNEAMELDDVRLYKLPFEQANNLISAADSTFSNGAGNWVLGNGATVTSDGVFDSGMSGDIRTILPFDAGKFENGKRYLVTMSIDVDSGVSALEHKFRLSLTDINDVNTTFSGGANSGIYVLTDETQTFTAILDSTNSNIADWATRDVGLNIGTNVWSPQSNYYIDDVRVVEIE